MDICPFVKELYLYEKTSPKTIALQLNRKKFKTLAQADVLRQTQEKTNENTIYKQK